MGIESLPLELRLQLGIIRFVESQQTLDHHCDAGFYNHEKDDDEDWIYHFSVNLRGQDGHFLGAIKRAEDGSFIEPVYLDPQSTPMGGLYEKIAECITKPHSHISVEMNK